MVLLLEIPGPKPDSWSSVPTTGDNEQLYISEANLKGEGTPRKLATAISESLYQTKFNTCN
jgi:hypothetical protein